MPEINLLQTRIKDHTHAWQNQVKLLLVSLGVILILLAGAGIAFMVLSQGLDQQIAAATSDNTKTQDQLNLQQKSIGDAKVFQAQVANIKTLLTNHVYLSPLFDEIGKMTYVKAQYVTIDVADTGKVHLEGLVDNYAGLAKLILGLSTSKHFQDVKLFSIAPAVGGENGYTFVIELTALPEVFSSNK